MSRSGEMIISAKKWQEELKRLCNGLQDSMGIAKDDFDDFEFERSLYYGAICLRKLNDTVLKPREFDFYGWSVKGNYYGPREVHPPTAWWFSVDANFDMTQPRPGTAPFSRIVDMIIHSKYLDCSYRTHSLIVGSDRKDQDGLPSIFEFSCDHFLECCAKVSAAEYKHMPPPMKVGIRS
jgi:hypothetical protein